MSFPVDFDFVIVGLGDGGAPEAFVTLCGIESIQVSEGVNTTDRFRRDCAKPGSTPKRKVSVTGSQWDVTGSGVPNMEQIDVLGAVMGIRKNYQLQFGRRDGTDAGTIVATAVGPAILTARNIAGGNGEPTKEITLAGEDDLVWDADS